jgi:hypothetical protein
MGWAEHITRMRRIAYRILVGKSDEKRLRERPRHRWEDNIKMKLKVSEIMDQIDARDRAER